MLTMKSSFRKGFNRAKKKELIDLGPSRVSLIRKVKKKTGYTACIKSF